MPKVKTNEERKEFLARIGLNPDAPALEPLPTRPVVEQAAAGIVWAPEGVDPHTMPVSDIVFTPEMVEHFADLSPRARNEPARYLFDQYKSYGRNKDRNSLLHRRIGEFLARVHGERTGGGGFVKDKIRLANTLAEHGITEANLQEYLAWKEGR